MLISPFPDAYRASGLLLHVTSLPSIYGIGDFGPSAFRWLTQLNRAEQSWWQVLPMGPTGFGSCPYQLSSTFALNPLLISPEVLIESKLLDESDIPTVKFGNSEINFHQVREFKRRVIEIAWKRFRGARRAELKAEFDAFCAENSSWLDDFTLFEHFRNKFKTGSFWSWPTELAARDPKAMQRVRDLEQESLGRSRFEQFLAFRQLGQLRAAARSQGVRLIGDLPIFVSPESSDVWANPELFLLDHQKRPRFIAGVPPDYFSRQGQLWGNPVYDWTVAKQTGYAWWMARIRALLRQVDVIRLDHFRGFAATWQVPAGAPNALSGTWQPGPGADFFSFIREEFGDLPFLAEDLGEITPDVIALRDQFQLTGMRVLQFAFDGNHENPFLPKHYSHNTVAYTGTHDNDTTRGWYQSLSQRKRRIIRQYLGRRVLKVEDISRVMIELLWSSDAALAIAPLQDVLNLGTEHRMNVPGCADGNWGWRAGSEILPDSLVEWVAALTRLSRRN